MEEKRTLNENRARTAGLGRPLLEGMEKMSHAPMAVQEKLLMKILSDNKDTEYGRKYGFSDIKSIQDYQGRVPLTTYDDFAPYIERMSEKGERNLIFAGKPVWYNKSSGTLGVPKRIPFSEETKRMFSGYNIVYEVALARSKLDDDKFFGGKTINLVQCGMDIKQMKDGVYYGPISEAGLMQYKPRWDRINCAPVEATFAKRGGRYPLSAREVRTGESGR